MACGDVLSLEDLQTAKKHQIFEAEVITGKAGGVAGGANIGTATNPVTGQTQQTLPSILADLGLDVQSWASSTGGVLASANQVFLNDTPGSLGLGDYYAWGGTFPKTVPAGTDPALPTSGYIMRSSRLAGVQAREALRRSYAEAGYNVVGTFQAGFTYVNVNDVGIDETTGKAFSGPAGPVAAGTNPTSGGIYVDVSKAYDNPRKNFKSVPQAVYDSVVNASGLMKFSQNGEFFIYAPQAEFVLSDITSQIPAPVMLRNLLLDINSNFSDGLIVKFDIQGTYDFGEISSDGTPHIVMDKDFDLNLMYNLVRCRVNPAVDSVHTLIRVLDTGFKIRNYKFDDTSYSHGNVSKGVAFFSFDNLTKSTSGYEISNGYTVRGRCILRCQSLDGNRQYTASDINITGYLHGEDVYYGITGAWSGNRVKGNYTVGKCNRAIFIYGCSGGDVSYYCRETHTTSGILMIKQYANSKVSGWDIDAHYGKPRGPVRFSAVAPATLNVEDVNIRLRFDDISEYPNTASVIFESNGTNDVALPASTLSAKNIKIDYTGPNNVANGMLNILTSSVTEDGYGVVEITGPSISASNSKKLAKNKYPMLLQSGSYMKYAELSDGALACKIFPKFIDNASPDIEDLYLTVIVKKDKTLRESLQKLEKYYVRLHRSTTGVITYIKTSKIVDSPDGSFNPTTSFNIGSFNQEYIEVISNAPDATSDITVYVSRV